MQWATLRTSDGSGMDHINPEDLPILLPSTLSWKWCIDNGVKSLAVKEARLWIAQANESIHKIHLALGFQSAIFCTQVRTTNSQQKKTCAWNAVKSVDTTVHEHAHIYSLACDAYQAICQALPKALDLLPLVPHDLHCHGHLCPSVFQSKSLSLDMISGLRACDPGRVLP